MTRPPTEPATRHLGERDNNASFMSRLAICRARPLNALLASGVVLELGCGDGWLTRELAQHHGLVIAVDPEADNVERAKRRVAGARVDVYRSRIETFEPPVGVRFDAIIAAGLLQSIESPVAILTRCKNWLANNGAILVMVPLGTRRECSAGPAAVSNLRKEFAAAGMRVRKTGGIMFKPVPRSKVHRLPSSIVAGHAALGGPAIRGELYAMAVRSDHRG